MPRYYLRHPLHPERELRKRNHDGLWGIYKSDLDNDFFLMVADGTMQRRWLVRYDPATASIIGPHDPNTGEAIFNSRNTFPVPDDWEGEP